MRKIITLLMLCIIVNLLSGSLAHSDDALFAKLEPTLSVVKNPFISQLPEIKNPEVEEPVIAPNVASVNQGQRIETPIQPPIVNNNAVVDSLPEIPIPSVEINGIIWNSERPQAIINGEILDIGDTILEIEITNIEKAGITGLFYGKEITLQP